jgi:hypothetical protein
MISKWYRWFPASNPHGCWPRVAIEVSGDLGALGGSIRFKVSAKHNLNFRADLARGKDGHTFSMEIGETFRGEPGTRWRQVQMRFSLRLSDLSPPRLQLARRRAASNGSQASILVPSVGRE